MAKVKKIFCNTCKIQTNHELGSIHYRYCQSDSELRTLPFIETVDLDEPIDFKENKAVIKYETWVCRGCDTVTLQESGALRKLVNNKAKKAVWTYDFHPQRTAESLPRKDFDNTPAKLYFFYYEVVESFNKELPVLCSMGLRALLEGICKDKGITDKDAWGLADKIDELAKRQPTKRAADWWDSSRLTGIFLASGFSCSRSFISSRPPAANANRWATPCKT